MLGAYGIGCLKDEPLLQLLTNAQIVSRREVVRLFNLTTLLVTAALGLQSEQSL